MSDFPTLTTARLTLRELTRDDAQALYAIHSDPVVMQWFGNDPVADLSAAEKMVEVFAGWRALPNPGVRWGIERRADGLLLGTCGLFSWHRAWRKCVLGYELGQFAWREGYMREALAAAIDWGFDAMALNRIEAQVHPDNAASLKTLGAFGFVREGRLREVGYWGGAHHDMLQLALLRRDHVAAPAGPSAP